MMLAQKFAVCEASCVPEGTWKLFISVNISGGAVGLLLSLSFCSFALGNTLLTCNGNSWDKNPELRDKSDQICILLPCVFFCIPASYLETFPRYQVSVY